MMDITRNQFFMIGLLLLLFGIQFRVVDNFVLTADATSTLAKMREGSAAEKSLLPVMQATGNAPRKILNPPDWLGWCLMSVGAVIVLHSLAMHKAH